MKIPGRKRSERGSVPVTKRGAAVPERARLLSEARRALRALPEVREEKVERFRSEVDSGDYRVDGEEVAEKIVSDAVREIRDRKRMR